MPGDIEQILRRERQAVERTGWSTGDSEIRAGDERGSSSRPSS
jgi:hypothetical protein